MVSLVPAQLRPSGCNTTALGKKGEPGRTAQRWRGSRSRRVDQVFLACGTLAVLGNLRWLQRPSERYHFGVVARKRRRDLRRDPMLQAGRGLPGEEPQGNSQQPPPPRPRPAVPAGGDCRAGPHGPPNDELVLHRGGFTRYT